MIEPHRLTEHLLRRRGPYAGYCNEVWAGSAVAFTYLARDRIPAHPWHIDVDDYDVRSHEPHHLENFITAKNGVDLVTFVPKNDG